MAIDIQRLAALMAKLNEIFAEIAALIERPALSGHVGEIIAAHIFDIELATSATNPGHDGRFRTGPLAGKSVNVKFYTKQQGILDINPAALPDYYLVLTGPAAATTSVKTHRPWVIDRVYILPGQATAAKVLARGKKVGVATSILRADWLSSEIYPVPRSAELLVTPAQCDLLGLFRAPVN